MAKDVLVLCIIFVICLSGTLARTTPIKDKNIEHKIEHMRVRVLSVKSDISTIMNRFKIIADNQPTLKNTIVSILKNVSDELTTHYINEEREARKYGTVLHNQPELSVLVLILSHKDEYLQKINTSLLEDPTPDNDTKILLAEVIKNIMNLTNDCYGLYIKEITIHPREWDSVDPVLNWKFFMTSESKVYDEKTTEAILRMQNIMNDCKNRLKEYQTEFAKILADYRSKLFDMAEVTLDSEMWNRI